MKKIFVLLLSLFLFFTAVFLTDSTVKAEISPQLVLSESKITLEKGKKFTFSAIIEQTDNPQGAQLVWESTDEAVFTVTNGTIQAKDGGTAELKCTATLEDGTVLTASAEVTVTVPVSVVKMNTPNNVPVYPDEDLKLDYSIMPENATDPSIEWSSKDESIAIVTEEGIVQAKQPGRTVITGKTKDGSNRTTQLTVYVPSMRSKTIDITLDQHQGKTYEFFFYGTKEYWDSNISWRIQAKGGDSSGFYQTDGYTVTVQLYPHVVGDVILTFSDKKDPQSKVIANIHVEESAIIEPYGVTIDRINIRQTGNYLNYNITVHNATKTKIAEVGYLIDYYNRFGEQVISYLSNGFVNGYSYTKPIDIDKGQIKTISENNRYFDKDDPVSKVRVAISHYRFEDGTTVIIPDSQLYWFDSEKGYYLDRPEIKSIYHMPEQEIFDKEINFSVGIHSYPCYSFIPKQYTRTDHPGLFVYDVFAHALDAGIRTGDIIYGIDDILWEDEPYMLEIAKAKMYDGQAVTFHVSRNGIQKDIVVERK